MRQVEAAAQAGFEELVRCQRWCTDWELRRGLGQSCKADWARHSTFVDIHSDEECTRLHYGRPQSFQMMWQHQAALALVSSPALPRGSTYCQSEVIMSRVHCEIGNKETLH
jgi:hypothetical protein